MIMKLDVIDKKLLAYLYHNYRSPITEVAKACRISRDQAEYRLKKFEKGGLIKKYLTIFNYSLLGYNDFVVVWLRLKSNNREKIKKELEGMKHVITVGDIVADYDIVVDFIFKDKYEFEKVFYKFIEEHEEDISDYSVFMSTDAEFFPLKMFGSKEEDSYRMVTPKEKIALEDREIQILRELEKNGRVRIIDIAHKLGISGELALYKLKQLRKKEVILGNRIQFDMQMLGFYFAVLRLKINNLNENLKGKIRSFCKNKPHTNALSFGISNNYNTLIQLFYQNEDELRKGIGEIREEFRKDISEDSLILLENEGNVKTLVI